MAVSNLRTPAIRVALSGLVVACGPLPGDVLPDSVDVSIVNPVAWPAGKLFVVSSAFRGRGDLPEIRLGTLLLAAARMNDSTVSADLPDTSGDFQLRLDYRSAERSGNVTLVGFTGRTETAALTGWPIPAAPGSPILIAAAESNLVRLDLAAGTVADLPIRHTATCAISPGPSFQDSVIVAQAREATTCGIPKAWRFEPVAVALDSAPYLTGPADRMWAQLAPSTWLETAHHELTIFTDGQVALREQLEEGERAVLSPDRSRAVVLTSNAPNHVPVLLTSPGTIAFRLPLLSAEAAAFTPHGDTLFAAGSSIFTPDVPLRLVAVDAANGAVLVQVDSLSRQLWDMVLDPDAPWLYGVEITDSPIVVVFDRRTLRSLGRLRPPATATCASAPCGQVGLAIDRATRTAYAFDVEGWGSSFAGTLTAVFRFDLVPVSQAPEILAPAAQR